MKNADFKITVLGMMLFAFWVVNLIGCESTTPPKPSKSFNDISEHALYHTGTIANINYHEDGTFIWYHDTQYTFTDGSVIRMDRIKCDHLPKIGEHGSLYVKKHYKDRNSNYMQNGDFLWIKDEETKISTSIKDEKPIVFIPSITTISLSVEESETLKKYDWKKAIHSKPPIYELVLLRLDNDIITTGRFNEKNEWVLETDRLTGGFPIDNIIDWKEVDIR